ncbi:DUF397 domain-containing protein [Actinomadura bangladeshensis]|uniref:DUF397 domain-containing protein n=1 Tax=Actinomadura bangladeshensis TaxID=453573 RepID=A0A6L9QN34_9ACTN|nr:DUF397 domain-containing protein [Actinomadura bangladeshensis]NEA26845.1 DUF397 domain-containing protein [Actinomadura bangladeshensis]
MTVQWRKSSHSGGAHDATRVELANYPPAWESAPPGTSDGIRLSVAGTFVGLMRQIKSRALSHLEQHRPARRSSGTHLSLVPR